MKLTEWRDAGIQIVRAWKKRKEKKGIKNDDDEKENGWGWKRKGDGINPGARRLKYWITLKIDDDRRDPKRLTSRDLLPLACCWDI